MSDQPEVEVKDDTNPPAPELTPHQKFLEMLPEDLRSEPSFLDFKGETFEEVVGKVAKSYLNTKKLVGADPNSFLKHPSSEDDKEGYDALWNRLGRPEDVKGYEYDRFLEKDFFEKENFEDLAKTAHELGLTKKQFNGLIEKYSGQIEASSAKFSEQEEATFKKYDEEIKEEWGQAYDQKVNALKSVLSSNAPEGFAEFAQANAYIVDHPMMVKLLDNILKLKAEDAGPSTGGSSSSMAMTPAEAMAEINAMDSDPEIMKIYRDATHPRRAELIEKRTKLFQMAYSK